jgi:6-phosphogluconolactonase (cycloisomerase 2 family)
MSRALRSRTALRLATVGGIAAAVAAFGFAPVANAAESTSSGPDVHGSPFGNHQADVFVQTNSPTGNAVLVYTHGNDGLLHAAGSYPTGGLGGGEAGAVVDPLASQGSLTYDSQDNLLFAVNAGSDTLSEFAVQGSRLWLIGSVPTGGALPTSVSVERGLVYVLDAGGDGAVTGFWIGGNDGLAPIPNSTRSLGLGNPADPNFLKAPSQVSISPSGQQLVVATKTNGVLDVFTLDRRGVPATAPVVTDSPTGSVPFALSYDSFGRLLVAEAAGGESSYWVQHDAELTPISSHVPDGQAATCWSVVAKGYLYDANAGSSTITGYSENWRGQLTLLNASGVTATTDAGAVDLAASGDGQFLYQEAAAAGAIDEFKVQDDGSLVRIGTVTGLPPVAGGLGIEGIAAS